MPITAENFKVGAELPKWDWESDKIVSGDGVERGRITSCPLADYWKEQGSKNWGASTARLINLSLKHTMAPAAAT
jgi:hypothetical protein